MGSIDLESMEDAAPSIRARPSKEQGFNLGRGWGTRARVAAAEGVGTDGKRLLGRQPASNMDYTAMYEDAYPLIGLTGAAVITLTGNEHLNLPLRAKSWILSFLPS